MTTHLADFTKKELEMLDIMIQIIEESGFSANIRQKTAIRLGISPVTVRTRLSRLRSKYAGTLRFVKEYRRYQQKLFQKTGGKFNPLSRSGRPLKRR